FNSLVCGAAVVAALSVLGGCSSSGRAGFAMGGTSAATPGGFGSQAGADAGASGGSGSGSGAGGGGTIVGGGGTGGTGGTGGGTGGTGGTGGGDPGTGGPGGPGGPVIRINTGHMASNSIITNAGDTVSAAGQ